MLSIVALELLRQMFSDDSFQNMFILDTLFTLGILKDEVKSNLFMKVRKNFIYQM